MNSLKTIAVMTALFFVMQLFTAPEVTQAAWDDQSDELPGFMSGTTIVLVTAGCAALIVGAILLSKKGNDDKNQDAKLGQDDTQAIKTPAEGEKAPRSQRKNERTLRLEKERLKKEQQETPEAVDDTLSMLPSGYKTSPVIVATDAGQLSKFDLYFNIAQIEDKTFYSKTQFDPQCIELRAGLCFSF